MLLAALQAKLLEHFKSLREERAATAGDSPVFALEHGLEPEELNSLTDAVRTHILNAAPSKDDRLLWIIYTAELGYRYSGDEYWQTFEHETPGWSLHGDRHWADSNRRIDLLGLDKSANLVVIELKRTEDGGHMELQAIRYAAMISTMTFEQAVDAHRKYLELRQQEGSNAAAAMLQFLGKEEPTDFNSSVRIVLASANFSKEITSSVLWLNEHGVDITCVRLQPHHYGDRVLLDVQQVIPLPEAAEFQIAIQKKSTEQRAVERATRDYTKYQLTINGHEFTRLNKRKFVLQIVKEAIRRGMTPEQIAAAVPSRVAWMFLSRPGQLSEDNFVNAARDESIDRYFTDEADLFHLNGNTYALTNQWGLQTEDSVKRILSELPDSSGISYEPVLA